VPFRVLENSDNTSLHIEVTPFTLSENGGTTILGYQIEMDDGQAGPYSVILGENADDPNAINLDTEVLMTTLIQSATYRARYRALNAIGFSPWSDPAYLLVAAAPNAPLKPVLVSVDES
jgi:hypothetical protein